jgi:hypothetical protein
VAPVRQSTYRGEKTFPNAKKVRFQERAAISCSDRRSRRSRQEVEAMHSKLNIIQEEVDRNFEAFEALLPSILGAYRDKFALMKDGRILGYYSSAEDAGTAASTFIPDGIYSIQKVTNESIDLGFFNYAVTGVPVQS